MYSSYRKAGTVDAFSSLAKNVEWNGPNELAYTPKYTVPNGESLELRFHVEPMKGNEKEVIPVSSAVPYYASADQAKIRAGKASAPATTGQNKYASQVILTLPAGFQKAYGITNGEIFFDANEDGARVLDASVCKIERDTCTVRLSWTGAASEASHVRLRLRNVPEGWFDPSPDPACLGVKCNPKTTPAARK